MRNDHFLRNRSPVLVIPPAPACRGTGANPDPATLHWRRLRVRLSVKESRMKFANATRIDRKSGVAQRRDLRFRGPFVDMFFDGARHQPESSAPLVAALVRAEMRHRHTRERL